jgi:hypothetical protein
VADFNYIAMPIFGVRNTKITFAFTQSVIISQTGCFGAVFFWPFFHLYYRAFWAGF